MSPKRSAFAVLLTLAPAMAWGITPVGTSTEQPPETIEELPPADETDADRPDLSGTWHMQMSVATEAQVPVLGRSEFLSHQDMVLRVSLEEGTYIGRHVACRVITESNSNLVENRFPDGFASHLPKKTYPLSVYRDGLGWRVDFDLKPQYLGYDPARSPSGPPKEADHPAMVDTDKDGAPGITVIASAPIFGDVEIYVAQVAHTTLSGRLEPSGRIAGDATVVRFDQWIVGATNRLFHRNPPVKPRPNASSFRMERVPEGTTCAQVLAR